MFSRKLLDFESVADPLVDDDDALQAWSSVQLSHWHRSDPQIHALDGIDQVLMRLDHADLASSSVNSLASGSASQSLALPAASTADAGVPAATGVSNLGEFTGVQFQNGAPGPSGSSGNV